MTDYFSALIASHGVIAIFASLVIGILTSLAPCSLVGLPLIAGFAANINSATTDADRSKFTHRFTLIFVLGVVVSISLLFILMAQFKYVLGSFPVFAYILIGVLSFYIGLAFLGMVEGVSTNKFVEKFAKFNLFGAFIIGLFVGVISSPCASPAIASIIIVAQKQTFLYSLLLVLGFEWSLIMPLLILLGFDPQKSAYAISFVIPFSTLGAFATYLSFVDMDWMLLGVVTVAAVVGGI